jgi:hypothetical protein
MTSEPPAAHSLKVLPCLSLPATCTLGTARLVRPAHIRTGSRASSRATSRFWFLEPGEQWVNHRMGVARTEESGSVSLQTSTQRGIDQRPLKLPSVGLTVLRGLRRYGYEIRRFGQSEPVTISRMENLLPIEIPKCSSPEGYEQSAINVEGHSPEKAQEARRQAVRMRAEQYGAKTEAERECLQAIFAYEWTLFKKHRKRQKAAYTWRMVGERGIIPPSSMPCQRARTRRAFEAWKPRACWRWPSRRWRCGTRRCSRRRR